MQERRAPRLAGRRLRIAAALYSSSLGGPVKRRFALVLVERPLAGVAIPAAVGPYQSSRRA